MAKFRNKYRIESNRLRGWNYNSNGMYFITLVTQNRVCNLSEIKTINGHPSVILTDFGKIVNNEWLKSFEIRNELFCDEYVIMPNHIHAIVVLYNPKRPFPLLIQTANNGTMRYVPSYKLIYGHLTPFYRLPKSISSFIAGFKSAVNSKIDDYIDEYNLDIPKYNRKNHFFQPNYYDHIIRNRKEYFRIKNYIRNNPKNWEKNSGH